MFSSLWRKLTTRSSKKNASKQPRRLAGRWRNRALPRLEWLEDRTAPAFFTVTTTSDDAVNVAGILSLRAAIDLANANGVADTINFNIAGGPGQTIFVGSFAGAALPTITEELTIDGTTQPGYTLGVPAITLLDTGTPPGSNGLFYDGAGDFTVFGIRIIGFDSNGIRVNGDGSNDIQFQDVYTEVNDGDGISIFNVDDVSFTSAPLGLGGVNSIDNFGAGLTLIRASSFTCSDGIFSDNYTGGVRLSDISGNVILTRVIANDNDFDGDFLGTGFEATDGVDGDSFAIGTLTINGGSYSVIDNNQFNGIFVQSVQNGITLQNSTGPTQQVTVEGNFADGVLIADGGTTGTFSNGFYLSNGGDGLDLNGFSGAVSLTNVTAGDIAATIADEGNGDDGLDIDGVTNTVTVSGGFYDGNDSDGILANSITTLTLNNVAPSLNGSDGLQASFIGTVNVTGGIFDDNGDDGIDLFEISGAVNINNVSLENNDDHGLEGSFITGTTTLTGSAFNDNNADGVDTGDGIHLEDVGAVVTSSVSALGNEAGIRLTRGTSLTDTDGTFSENDDGGIFIEDISGAVTLTRTTANDNDFDGSGEGDGLHAQDGNGDADFFAIGGTLTVNGGSFSETSFGPDQMFGVWIDRMGGLVTFQNSGAQQVVVDDNDKDGVFIGRGTSATFTNGQYVNNDGIDNGFGASDGDGIHLENFTGTVTLNGVNASFNADNGFDADNIDGTTTISGGTFSSNDQSGIELTDMAAVVLNLGVVANDNGDGTGAVAGIFVGGATSFSDTGGTFNDNDDGGVVLFDVAGSVTLSGTTANRNDADGDDFDAGIIVVSSGATTFTNVTANNNSTGAQIADVASFSDTGGIYRRNNDHGIQLIDIAGNVTLSGTTLENNDQDNDGDGDGLNATFSAQTVAIGGNLSISNAIIRDTGGVNDHQERGVFVDGVAGNVTLTNNTVTGNEDYGVRINDIGGNVLFSGGTYSNNGNEGVFLDGVAGTVTANNVTANDNADDGFFAQDVVGASIVNEGIFNGNDIEGIEFQGCADVTLNNVTATGNGDSGALIEECVGTFTANGGVFSNNDNHGIFIQDHIGNVILDGITAENNDADDNGTGNGVFIEADATLVALTGNLTINNSTIGNDAGGVPIPIPSTFPFVGTQQFGVRVESVTGTVSMSSNTVTFNQNEGVQIDNGGTTASFSGGTYTNNAEDGIDLTSFGGTITLANVTVEFNGSDGLEVRNSQDLDITGGSFSGNVNDGMDLFNVNDVFLTNVTVNDNGSNGLEADNVGHVFIDPSFFNGNAEDGIHIETANDINIADTQANNNGDDGIDLFNVLIVTVTDTTASNNAEDGLDVSATNGQSISVLRGFYNDNTAHGLNIGTFGSVGGLTLTNVTATGNDLDGVHGVNLADTTVSGGNFSNNTDDGLDLDGNNVVGTQLVLSDAGVANNNGDDGLFAQQYPNGAGTDVSITGWQFNNNGQTTGTGDGVELLTVGDVAFTDVTATGNADDGVFIDGAASATFTNGSYSANGDNGIDLNAIVTVVLTDVTANGNTGATADGLEASNITTLAVTRGTYNSNGDDGIDLRTNITTATLNGVTMNSNGDHGLRVGDNGGVFTTLTLRDIVLLSNVGGGGHLSGVTTVFYDTTFEPPGNTVADRVEFFPTTPGGPERFQHTRGATALQAITLNNIGTLDVDFFGGDDFAVIHPGTYTEIGTLDLDGGNHILGDTILFLGTPNADNIDIGPGPSLVILVNGAAPTVGIGTFNVINFEILGIDALAGNDDVDFIAPFIGLPFTTISVLGNDGDDNIDASAVTPGVGQTLILDGGNNNDTIFGSQGNDSILGGSGNDSLVGNAGNDTIRGEAGNDSLEGGAGNDSLDGAAGNDTYFFNGTLLGQDVINDLPGCVENDTLNFAGFTAVGGITIDLSSILLQSVNPGDLDITLTSGTSIEHVVGTTNSDSITGNICTNNLQGGNGNDTLIGAAGNDTLNGGAGDDFYPYFGTGLGTDTIVDLPGCVDSDTLDFSGFTAGGVTVNLGITTTQVVSVGNLSLIFAQADSIERLIGTNLAGAGDSLTGNICNNFIDGLDGNDTIVGAAGSDTLEGGNQNDLFIWNNGDGSDTIDGEAGTDEVEVNGNNSAVTPEVFTLQKGGGRIQFDRTSAVAFNLNVGTVETFDINMNAGNDQLTATMDLPGVTTLDVDGGANDDIFILDYTTSNTLPTTVIYTGGTGNDIMRQQGAVAPFTAVRYTATSATAGNVNLDGQIITFNTTERLDHVKATGDLRYDLTIADNNGQIVNGPTVNGFATTQVASTNNTFPTLNFGNLSAPGTFTLAMQGGADRLTINNPTPGDGLTSLSAYGHNPELTGDDGQFDRFTVTPSATVPYFIHGNDPLPLQCPGDSLDILTAGLIPPTVTTLNPTGPGEGFYSFTNGYETVTFESIEDLSNRQIVVVGTDYGTIQRVTVYDATTMTELPFDYQGLGNGIFNPFADIAGFKSGIRVAAGDVNGDCYPDIVVAAGPQSKSFVRVYDGLSARLGTIVQIGGFQAFEDTFTGGTFVAVADFDGDGFGEIVVGAGKPSTARIRVFSGAEVIASPTPGLVFPEIVAFPTTFKGGARVATGDYDGDGNTDIAVTFGSGQVTRVRVIDGSALADGFQAATDLLDDFRPFGSGFRRGAFISMVDLDGDGRESILVSQSNEAILQNVDFSVGAGVKINPLVRSFEYDGFNYNGGNKVHEFQVTSPALYPSTVNGGVRLGASFDGSVATAFFLTAPGKTNPLSNFPLVQTIKRFKNVGVVDALFAGDPSNVSSTQGYFVAGSKRNDGRIL